MLVKKNPVIKHFFFKKMVIEMFLNSDIQKQNCSNFFTFFKGNKCK
jgi:hypothetical protein